MSIFVFTAVFCGYINGYVTARYLKFFGKTDMLFATLMSAVALPLFIISAALLEILFDYVDHDPRRYRFQFPILQTIGWYLINALLCYSGAYKGYLQIADNKATPVGQVARPIPTQPWYLSVYTLSLVSGLIQFFAIYREIQ